MSSKPTQGPPEANAPTSMARDQVTRTGQAQTNKSQAADASAGLLALLKVEAEAREAGTLSELQFLIASETRKLTRSRQVFVFGYSHGNDLHIEVISGLPTVDRSAPLVVGMERVVAELGRDQDLRRALEFDLGAYAKTAEKFTSSYPFSSLLWLPLLSRSGNVIGGMLLTREQAWNAADVVVGKRLSQTFAHAMREISAVPRLSSRVYKGRKTLLVALGVLSASMCVPVSMTALAPFEVSPRDGFIIAAPVDGIIEDILVEPNSRVEKGQPLVRFVDTLLKNRLEIAEREVLVANARLKKATQLAFVDPKGRHELGVAMSELELKTAERDFARDMLARSEVHANRSGIAVFTDKKQFIGKPVGIGERIMEIADPNQVEAAVDVPVGDAIVLKPGARVKLFLDADPLRAREASILIADYQARPRPGNQVAFRVIAKLSDEGALPRLGARGTAQLYGEAVPLGFYLFRRPLTALRQWTGI